MVVLHREPKVTSVMEINGRSSGLVTPVRIKKDWGYELMFHNDDYCSKWLHINKNHKGSMHFHVIKEETLVCIEGVLHIEYIVRKEHKTIQLHDGEAFTIAPGLPHRLMAPLGDVDLIESSTYDVDEDSVRIA